MEQPISNLEWVDAGTLKANAYNPNHVAKPELALLKISLMEDGWTQPLVITQEGEIIDGFHRWTLASTDKDVGEMSDGMVPVVVLNKPLRDRMMSTIRHNRARGVHNILSMGEISTFLSTSGLSDKEIIKRLGMDKEEYGRLTDNLTMVDHGEGEYSPSWLPKFESDAD
jgi:ParB-like chromosome segregation protein Spo0J